MAGTKQKPTVKWDERFIIRAYKLAEAGQTDAQIARELGVAKENFHRWVDAHPGLKLALQEARNPPKNPDALREYVYGRLPDHLQELWDRIDYCQDADSGYERARALLANHGDNALQHLFLYGLTRSHFNPSRVCSMLGIRKERLERWLKDDPDFAELLEYVHQGKGDFFEAALIGKVEEGDVAAILHVNRTYNKARGYGDSVKVEGRVGGKVSHVHSGRVENLHVHVGLGELQLSRECATELMEKYLAKKREKENGAAGAGHPGLAGQLPGLPAPPGPLARPGRPDPGAAAAGAPRTVDEAGHGQPLGVGPAVRPDGRPDGGAGHDVGGTEGPDNKSGTTYGLKELPDGSGDAD